MQFNFRDVLKKNQPSHYEQDIVVDQFQHWPNNIKVMSPFHVTLQAISTRNEVVEVDGHIEGKLEYQCARCLTHFQKLLHVDIQEIFYQSSEYLFSEELDHAHEIQGEQVDLMPYIEENILIALPFVAVCKEDCVGLCPTCGIDRNLQECQCNHEKIDIRLAGLADFFKSET